MYEIFDKTQNECIFSINYSIVNFDLMQKYLLSVKENIKKVIRTLDLRTKSSVLTLI